MLSLGRRRCLCNNYIFSSLWLYTLCYVAHPKTIMYWAINEFTTAAVEPGYICAGINCIAYFQAPWRTSTKLPICAVCAWTCVCVPMWVFICGH